MKKLKVEEKLGSGAFAEVYLAHDTSLDRKVAIKIIREEYLENDSVAISHAKTLAALPRHQNVVQIYSVGPVELNGVVSGVKSVVEMEWINGDNLAKRLKGPRFSVPEGKKICAGLQCGIHHMHSHDIVHGDFHPGNVLVDGDFNAIVIDAANRHKATAFRTTYANIADLIRDDLASLQFSIRLVIQYTKLAPADAFMLMEKVGAAESVLEVGAICQNQENWSEPTRQFVSGNVSKSSATQIIQLLENSQYATLREVAISGAKELAEAMTDDDIAPMNCQVNDESLTSRIETFEHLSNELSSVIGVLAAWSPTDATDRIQLDVLRLLLSKATSLYMSGTFQRVWQTMRLYPVIILFYSACYAAFRNGRYGLLRRILESASPTGRFLLEEINIGVIDLESTWNEIIRSRRYTPVSDRIVSLIPSQIPAFSLSIETAVDDFDELQTFLSCVLIDQAFPDKLEPDEATSATRNCGLKGRFLWRFKERPTRSRAIEDDLLAAAARDGRNWAPLLSGFFGGKHDRAMEVFEYSKLVHNRLRQGYHIF